MSKSKKNSETPFDPSICFNFFPSWVEAIRQQSETDPDAAVKAFLVLADYSLYGKEPDPTANPWGFGWSVVKGEIDRSVNNRRRRFGDKDIPTRDKVIAFHNANPNASQRAIAAAIGCSVGTVNDTLKALRNQAEKSRLHIYF